MHDLYTLLTGPFAWASILIFFGGAIYKIIASYKMAAKNDRMVLDYWHWGYAARSWWNWLKPGGSIGWREHRVLNWVTLVFHLCFLLLGLFALGHAILLETYLGIGWLSLPASFSELLTIVAIACCGYFIYRRISNPTARFTSTSQDWFLIICITVVFVTALATGRSWGGHESALFWLNLHILSAEILLVIAPFTRISHMVLGVLTRGYMGSEFGAIRKTRDY